MSGATTVFRGDDAGGAVAVRDGFIVAAGLDALDEQADEVVDIGTGVVRPAFRDGHVHPLWGGQSLLGAPIAGSASVDEVLDRLRQYVDANPGDGWVVGAGYDPALLPGGLGRAELIDAVVGHRPVLLWATDHHSAWVNSAALQRAGIDAGTADPANGRIVRDAAGAATGALLEDAAQDVAALLPAPSAEVKADGLRRSMALLAAAGVTWVQDASLLPADLGVYAGLAAEGALPCRVNVALKADPVRWREQVAEFVAARASLRDGAGVTATTVKFFADGIIEAGTAAMLEPYSDNHASCGIANWPADELAAAAAAVDAEGFQIHIHAIGDAAVRHALDAVEHAGRANGARDRRAVIAHTQLVHPDDLPRFAALGVIANFEPLWAQRDPLMTELTEPRLGPTRSAWQYPMGALAERGAHVSFGSDWPVSSLRPLDGLAIAVTRQTRGAAGSCGPLSGARMSLDAAMAAYTRGVAYQAFEEGEVGRVAVGQRADLCVLAAAPDTASPDELPDIAVLGTWRDGRAVYRA
jgi:predicted amidohydrolase YtcJ